MSAAPMSSRCLRRRGSAGTGREATPEPPSLELEETATALPRTFALAAGAVIAPVGLVESLVKVRTVALLVLPAASVEVTDSVGLLVSPAFQAKLLVVT